MGGGLAEELNPRPIFNPMIDIYGAFILCCTAFFAGFLGGIACIFYAYIAGKFDLLDGNLVLVPRDKKI